MRTIIRASLGMMGLAVVAMAAMAAAAPAPAAAPAAEVESPLKTEELRFDIFVDTQKVGHMVLKIMTVRDVVIFEEEFVAPFKGQEAGFDSQIIYRGEAKPVPQSAKATTRVGSVNLMEGTLTFKTVPTGLACVETVTGYADAARRPLEKPLAAAKESPVPAGLVLTYPAMLYFAPRLLSEAGEIPAVVYAHFPADVDFPSFVKFDGGVVLSRGAETAEGRSEFMVKRVFPGGNIIGIATMVTDKDGKIVESRIGRFTLRPEGKPKPTKPAAAK
jgi:hypothetical protein